MGDFEYKDYYRILGVRRDAGIEEIKRAYRKLARENHPDFNPSDSRCEDRLKEINLSYEILTDQLLRGRVDSWLEESDFGHFERSAFIREREEVFCHETHLKNEWSLTIQAMKWSALLFIPPILYVFSEKNEFLHESSRIIVIPFVGAFYGAIMLAGKAVFHGATVWVMRTAEEARVGLQIKMIILVFALPLIYFAGSTVNWSASAEKFINHTWVWFMFAIVIISLAWVLGSFYRSPMISRFPFRIFLLAVYLTAILAFCKAIPLADKGEVFFDYIFFNITMQTVLFISIRGNRKTWKTP